MNSGHLSITKATRRLQQLTADHSGTGCPPTASESTPTTNPADTPDVTAFASTLEPHVEPLSEAIVSFLEQRDLLECEGDLAQAVTAVNRSFEYLKHSPEKRTKLTAAIDRLHTTVGTQARQLQQLNQISSESIQRFFEAIRSTVNHAIERQSPTFIDAVRIINAAYRQERTNQTAIRAMNPYSVMERVSSFRLNKRGGWFKKSSCPNDLT
jgi:dGTP triphosphohydrolase